MSNEKPAELTEAERDALMYHIGSWKFTARQSLASAEDAFMRDVAAIVAAREAAARREALLEAERLGKVVHDAATDLLNISAYLIRASYHEDVDRLERALRSGSARGKALRDRLRAALAEPERDEEGGR